MPTGDVALASMAGMATRPGADGFLQDGDGSALSRVSCSPEAKTGGLVLVGPAKHAQHVQVSARESGIKVKRQNDLSQCVIPLTCVVLPCVKFCVTVTYFECR